MVKSKFAFLLTILFLFHSSSVVEQSAVNRSVVGSNPTCGASIYASIAQQVEHFHGKEGVVRSNRIGSFITETL